MGHFELIIETLQSGEGAWRWNETTLLMDIWLGYSGCVVERQAAASHMQAVCQR